MLTIDILEDRIGYKFNDISLVKQSLTHRSASTDHVRGNNERLEFLGDRVLGLVVADIIFKASANATEGDLARQFTSLVRRETLVKVAEKISLSDHLIMSGHEKSRDVQFSQTVLSDACEALIAAIYLDGGFDAVVKFIKKFWLSIVMDMDNNLKDSKSALQEWAQGRGLPLPEYKVVDEKGQAHLPEFKISVLVKGFDPVTGIGKNKREASQNAAKEFLERIVGRG